MGEYWEAFIVEFKEEIPYKALRTILKAFFYYAKDDIDTAEGIMTHKWEEMPPDGRGE